MKELFQTMDKTSISNMLTEVFGETTTPFPKQGESSSKDKDDIIIEDFNNAQDPNERFSEGMIETMTVYIKGDK